MAPTQGDHMFYIGLYSSNINKFSETTRSRTLIIVMYLRLVVLFSMLYWCLLILITLFEIQTGIASKYSEVSIIENLPLEKNHFSENWGGSTYTVITAMTSDSTHKICCLHLGVL